MQAVASANAASWEQVFANRGWGKYPPETLVRFVARRFGRESDRSKIQLLEVGCGPGANVWYMAREGFSVSAIDFSPSALEQARGRLTDDGLDGRVDLRHGDFSCLPWADGSFDAVVDVEAIYANNLTTIQSVLGEIQRVLRPGGVFFGIMFGKDTTGYDPVWAYENGTMDNPETGPCQGHLTHFFDEAELRSLFGGFKTLTIDSIVRTDGDGAVKVAEWLVTAER